MTAKITRTVLAALAVGAAAAALGSAPAGAGSRAPRSAIRPGSTIPTSR